MTSPKKVARTVEPERSQGWLFMTMPGANLAEDHPVRVVAETVEKLDLTAFTENALSVEGHAGRPLTSPRLKLALWMYGLQQGIGEATEIARRCTQDEAFRWLAGGVEVSHDVLSEFLTGHRRQLEGLFTQVLGLLLHHGLLDLERVAQDGIRIRASASAPSFRRRNALKQCREQARLHLKAVLAQSDDPETSRQQRAARESAARRFATRMEQALVELEKREAEDAARKAKDRSKTELRASTTDPEARVMKMADGGFRPGYNVQLAVSGSPEGGPRTIVGVQVTNRGNDAGSVGPMLVQVERRTGQLPEKVLADGQHATVNDVKACLERGVQPCISLPERMSSGEGRADRSPEMGAWRSLMQSEAGKSEARARASLVENVNAQVKSRYGVEQCGVRGLDKVSCVALMVALAHNIATHGPALLQALAG